MKIHSVAIWFLLFLIAIVGSWLVLFKNENLPANNQFSVSSDELVFGEVEVAKKNTENKPVAIDQAVQPYKRSATDVAVVNDWMRKSGYRADDREVYKHYTDEQLINLIEQGDINAMYVMEDRKFDAGGFKAAIPYAQRAIIYGSLEGIKSMGIYTQPKTGEPFDVQKEQLMESFAYYSMLGIRGDTYFGALRKKIDLELFKKEHKVETVFSSEDEAWIESRATELYEGYQAERNKLGLGDFDNEVPEEVKEFFGNVVDV